MHLTMKQTTKKEIALLLAVILLLFDFAISTQTVAAAEGDWSDKWGTIRWQLDELTGVLTIEGTGEVRMVATMIGTENANKVKSVVVKDGITTLGYNAFCGCTTLAEITIPKSVTRIAWGAFSDCTELKEITIPDSVTEIGWNAFYGCTGLTKITIPDSVTTIGDTAFRGCTGLMDANGCIVVKGVLHGIDETREEITVPSGVTKIASSAFSSQKNVKKVTLPDGVMTISASAFNACRGLTEINIPDSVTRIDERTFSNCTSLLEITIPDSVQQIGNAAFASCTSLRKVTMPEHVKLGNEAFSYCKALADDNGKVVINGNLCGLANGTAKYKKENPLYIGNEIKEITILLGGINYDAIVLDEQNTAYVKGESGLYTAGYKVLIQANDNLDSCEIPDTCTEIAYGALSRCYYESVTIPASVTSIYNGEKLSHAALKDGAVIYGEEGSYAQEYAQLHNYEFKSKNGLEGDVNGDGVVNLADVQEILKIALNINPGTEEYIQAADVDKDLKITLYDAGAVLKSVLKLIE